MTTSKPQGFESGLPSFPFGELRGIRNTNRFIVENIQLRKPSLKNMNASQYLTSIESSIPSELICSENYSEIKALAAHFTGGITSFFGFETRLNSTQATADYLFAVSSQRGEREALAQLLTNGSLPEAFRSKTEWQNVARFAAAWANPSSELYSKVLGLWFEFDTAEGSSEAPVPSIFLHAAPFQIKNQQDKDGCMWLTKTALPLLTGQPMSPALENRFYQALEALPGKAAVFNIGVMLSRATAGLRLILIRMNPDDIIPYLTSLGWTDTNNGLQSLICDLKKLSSRIVLHIGITENGVDAKIGFECAFSEERYHQETNWTAFFDYLIAHNACTAEKKDTVLGLFGVDTQDASDFSLESYTVAPRLTTDDYTPALVRYLSHIKVNYKPNHSLEAKAYPGVRLLGTTKKLEDVSVQ